MGIDVATEENRAAIKSAATGQLEATHSVDNTPRAIAGLIAEIRAAEAEHGPATVAIGVLAGMATLPEAMLLADEPRVVHTPGRAVNRAGRGIGGAKHTSDPEDAGVIAYQARTSEDLRVIEPARDIDVELGLPAGRRAEIAADRTRRAQHIMDLPVLVFPGLEGAVDVTGNARLHLLIR